MDLSPEVTPDWKHPLFQQLLLRLMHKKSIVPPKADNTTGGQYTNAGG